ncbi:hypothetical protein GUO98_004719 [Salmonella enterica]|nr:hypothetical protein [Salmonella enterica]
MLRPLPVQPWHYRYIKKAKVNIDYHVEYEWHHYSVPHQHVGKTVERHAFNNLLEVWSDGQMIASHPRRLLSDRQDLLAAQTVWRCICLLWCSRRSLMFTHPPVPDDCNRSFYRHPAFFLWTRFA